LQCGRVYRASNLNTFVGASVCSEVGVHFTGIPMDTKLPFRTLNVGGALKGAEGVCRIVFEVCLRLETATAWFPADPPTQHPDKSAHKVFVPADAPSDPLDDPTNEIATESAATVCRGDMARKARNTARSKAVAKLEKSVSHLLCTLEHGLQRTHADYFCLTGADIEGTSGVGHCDCGVF
jgi:hypothetical protein